MGRPRRRVPSPARTTPAVRRPAPRRTRVERLAAHASASAICSTPVGGGDDRRASRARARGAPGRRAALEGVPQVLERLGDSGRRAPSRRAVRAGAGRRPGRQRRSSGSSSSVTRGGSPARSRRDRRGRSSRSVRSGASGGVSRRACSDSVAASSDGAARGSRVRRGGHGRRRAPRRGCRAASARWWARSSRSRDHRCEREVELAPLVVARLVTRGGGEQRVRRAKAARVDDQDAGVERPRRPRRRPAIVSSCPGRSSALSATASRSRRTGVREGARRACRAAPRPSSGTGMSSPALGTPSRDERAPELEDEERVAERRSRRSAGGRASARCRPSRAESSRRVRVQAERRRPSSCSSAASLERPLEWCGLAPVAGRGRSEIGASSSLRAANASASADG